MTPEQLAKRIIELDPDPAAIELAAHLKRQFDVGFNAGLEAARKVAESYEPKCDTCPSGVTSAISALTVPSDLVAVPREPTKEMIDAADKILAASGGWVDIWPSDFYRAMIAATEERG